MKTCVLAATIGVLVVSSQHASACGGSGGIGLSGGKVARGGGVPLVAAAPSFNPAWDDTRPQLRSDQAHNSPVESHG